MTLIPPISKKIVLSISAKPVHPLSELIIENQHLSGGFESVIRQPNYTRKDVNACITTLIIRELKKKPGLVGPKVIDNALNFIFSCASLSSKGAYNFYPQQSGADKATINMKIKVPDDADDTALISLLLFQAGKLNRNELIRYTSVVLDKYRLQAVSNFDPPWFTAGVFYTWLKTGSNNIIDCCVNANIVALYAFAGLRHLRGYQEACELISNAVNWCDKSELRLASIIPFYADKQELYFAVEHAVNMGSSELIPALKKLEWTNPRDKPFDAGRPICCSAYRKISWRCALLQQLRKARV
jgi:hypothetical protein